MSACELNAFLLGVNVILFIFAVANWYRAVKWKAAYEHLCRRIERGY